MDQARQKVVIIAAEKEIASDSYARRKEKLIGYTLDFSPPRRELIDSVVKSVGAKDPQLNAFLAGVTPAIDAILPHKAPVNLRSVKQALRVFERAYRELLNAQLWDDRIGEALLKLVLGVVLESRDNVRNVTRLRAVCRPGFDEVALYMRMHAAKSAQSKSPAQQDAEYLSDFLARYGIQDLRDAPSYSAIYEYVFDGYLNVATLLADAKRHASLLRGVPADSDQAFLGDFRELSDERFNDRAEHWLTRIDKNDLRTTRQIYHVMQRLSFFAASEALRIPLPDLLGRYTKLLDHLEQTDSLEAETIDPQDPVLRQGDITDKGYLALCDRLFKLTSDALAKGTRKEIVAFFRLAENDEEEFGKRMEAMLSTTDSVTPVFDACEPDRLAGAVAKFPNRLIAQFSRTVYARYRVGGVDEFLSIERPALTRIADELERAADGRAPQLSRLLLRDLADKFRTAASRLK